MSWEWPHNSIGKACRVRCGSCQGKLYARNWYIQFLQILASKIGIFMIFFSIILFWFLLYYTKLHSTILTTQVYHSNDITTLLTEQYLHYLQFGLLTLVTMQYSQLNTEITCRKLLQSLTILATYTTKNVVSNGF